MKRYGVNWLRLWLANIGCLTPFLFACLEVTDGFTPTFLLLQQIVMASMGAYGKYKTTGEELHKLDDSSARAELLRLRRLTLANRRKRSEIAQVFLPYTTLAGCSLFIVLIAHYLDWIPDTALMKAIVYAFGIPVVSVGSFLVAEREIDNSDVNRELDRQIAREDAVDLHLSPVMEAKATPDKPYDSPGVAVENAVLICGGDGRANRQ